MQHGGRRTLFSHLLLVCLGHIIASNRHTRSVAETGWRNKLYYGGNLHVMREHVPAESVDLVYLDPPFNSNRSYNVIFGKHTLTGNGAAAQIQAFDDTWRWTPVTDDQYQPTGRCVLIRL